MAAIAAGVRCYVFCAPVNTTGRDVRILFQGLYPKRRVFTIRTSGAAASTGSGETIPMGLQIRQQLLIANLLAGLLCLPLRAFPHPLRYLELAGPAGEARAELSGLAWHGDQLILLPQFPERFLEPKGLDTGAVGRIFALKKKDIVAALRNTDTSPLYPAGISVLGPQLRTLVPGYEGFEAIAIDKDQAWLAIEARAYGLMRGYLIRARFVPGKGLVLDPKTLTKTLPPANIRNMGFEALLLAPDRLIALFEINAGGRVPRPTARVFSRNLKPLGSIPMPRIEYRLTDATPLDKNQYFWASNFYWQGEYATLKPGKDPVARRFDQSPIDPEHMNLERLLCLRYSPQKIELTDTPPVIIGNGIIPRNWEGIARLSAPPTGGAPGLRGLLLATDKYPVTLLAFVPLEPKPVECSGKQK